MDNPAKDYPMIDNRQWPLAQVMVLTNLRLLFCPIGKNACTTLKRVLVSLSDCPDKATILAGDVHSGLDLNTTGLQLKDYSPESASAFLRDPSFAKTAVLRDPLKRLVSAYIEKFVLHRTSESNHRHTAPVVAWCQKSDDYASADMQKSITFRQFSEYLLAHDPDKADPHWRRQSNYLRGIRYSQVFSVDNLGDMERFLGERAGKPVTLEHRNATRLAAPSDLPEAAELSADQIEARWPITSGAFLGSKSIREPLMAYYADDYEWLKRVQTGVQAA